MPIERNSGESRDEFVSRCVSIEMDSGKPQEQALAICLTYADEFFVAATSSATSSVSDATWSTEAPISINLENFSRVKKVIFNEDFDEDKVQQYKDLGYKVYIRSSRKIKKKDKKVWNKLRTVGLTEDALVFGEVKDLHKRYDFDLLMTGQDPLLEALKLSGSEVTPKKILKSEPVYSLAEAREVEQRLLSEVDLKFVTVQVLYTYEEIPGIPAAKSGSRDFCKTMTSNRRFYTLEEISRLPNEHLKEMFKNYSLEPDVFQYRGGFYRLPGTLTTTPYCRHYWKANVSVV